jgi:hypothetical protein
MTNEKFKSEIESLDKFFTLYCHNKHTDQKRYSENINYRNHTFDLELNLCDECKELLSYSIIKLQTCIHEDKPRCRKCKNPCYDKEEWKKIAKLMRYSGIQLGLVKLKRALRLKN